MPPPPSAPRAGHRNGRLALAVGLGTATGAMVAAQGRTNASLGAAGMGVIMATWVCYLVTIAAMLAIVVGGRRWGHTVRVLRARARWWWFAIGLCGMPIVIAMSQGVPIIGVALASVCSVAGQTISGLVLDARGIGVPRAIGLTFKRAVAGLSAVAGLAVVVVAAPVPDAATPLSVAMAALFLFVSGFVLSAQQAGNGQVAGAAGDPIIPALTATVGGLTGISVITAVSWTCGWLPHVTWPSFTGHWWLYTGGVLGALITVAAAWTVRRLGTFALTLVVVGGQMVMAVVLDVAGAIPVGWPTMVAMAAVAASVVLTLQRPSA